MHINFAKIVTYIILENFILRQISENFSDLGIKVTDPWDTNSELGWGCWGAEPHKGQGFIVDAGLSAF